MDMDFLNIPVRMVPAKTTVDRLVAIVKPTQVCNIACTYCYVFEEGTHKRMSDETLERTIEQLLAAIEPGGELEIVWHGGEPSVLGLKFYERALDYERKYRGDKLIRNAIQTNAYKLKPEFMRFLRDNNFSVGVSLDGTESLNDRCRVTHKGKGTFSSVRENIRTMKRMGISLGAVCVITGQNKHAVREIYEFFHEEGIPFRFNPLIKTGAARRNLLHQDMSVDEYADVVIELFDLWWADEGAELRVATIEDLITAVLTRRHVGCENSPNCQNHFIGVGPNGDVYPCGRFEGMAEFSYGNLVECDMHEIMASGRRQNLLKRDPQFMPGCPTCKWLKICHGGCMHNALEHSHDIMTKDELCQATKRIYSYVEDKLLAVPNFEQTLRDLKIPTADLFQETV